MALCVACAHRFAKGPLVLLSRAAVRWVVQWRGFDRDPLRLADIAAPGVEQRSVATMKLRSVKLAHTQESQMLGDCATYMLQRASNAAQVLGF